MEEAIIQACKVQDGIKSIGQNLKWTGGFLGKFSLIKADPYKRGDQELVSESLCIFRLTGRGGCKGYTG